MATNEEKRMAGDYVIFQTISVGHTEIVMGENPKASAGERYMCSYCTNNLLFAQYSDVIVSDDYIETLELFQQRVREETEKLREELVQPEREGIDDRAVTNEGFVPIDYDDDINGKVIVIRQDALKREYRRAMRQYQLCTGGFHLALARLGRWAALPAAGVLACAVVFGAAYVREFGGRGNVNFFPGLGEAVAYAETLEPETVYVTDTVNQPYIFALFYGRTPPETFVSTVEYRDENAAFRHVKRFAGWEFDEPDRAQVWILWRGQEQGTPVAQFGCFTVCVPGG